MKEATGREPLVKTLLRTVAIALLVGVGVSRFGRTRYAWWFIAMLAFWFSFGGHWVEVIYLRLVRPHVSVSPAAKAISRIIVWFIGGVLLGLGMELTATIVLGDAPARWPAWYVGGIAFIALELIVHLLLQLFKKPSFFNGRG